MPDGLNIPARRGGPGAAGPVTPPAGAGVEAGGLAEVPPLQVNACPHPFTTEVTRVELPAGLTVAEILEIVQPDPVLRRHAHIYIGPHYIRQEIWHRVRPNPGMQVMIRVVPGKGGGGKNPLRTFLMLAVVAVSIVAPYAAPAAWGLVAATGGLTTAGALVSAGIGIVGGLIVNALVPPPKQDLGRLGGTDRSDSPTLSGARNQAIPYGVVPWMLGRFRQTPPLAAATYTEIVGDDVFLRMLVSWGLGPRHFRPFKIGETLLSDFSEVEISTRRGWYPAILNDRGGWDASTGSFPADPAFGDRWEVSVAGTVEGVAFEAGDTLIYHGLEDDAIADAPGWDRNGDQGHALFANDPFEQPLAIDLPPGGSRRIVTTQPDSDEWSFDIAFQQGLIWLQADGDRRPWTRQFLVEISPAGEGQWETVTTLTVKAKKAGVVRRGLRRLAPSRGQWDIGITPLPTPSGSGDIFQAATLTALRSFRHVSPLNTPGEASSALRVKATGQLQGVIEQLNAVNTSVLPDWDPVAEAWPWRPTNRPAALYRALLQGVGNAKAQPDAKVDLVALEDWAEKCIDRGWEANVVLDYETTVRQALSDIASAGRAALARRGGKYSVVIDEADKPIVGHFTPRNTNSFRGNIVFPKLPHGFRARFFNEERDYLPDERIVYADGYDADNATRLEGIDLPPLTKPELVWKFGRYFYAEAQLRREGFSWGTDIEHIVCTRGDRSVLAHDVVTVGLAWPRVKSLTLDGPGDGTGDVIAIELDEEVEMESGQDYGLAARTIEDARLSIPLVNAEDKVTTVVPATPVAAALGLAEGDLVSFGLLGQETLDVLITAIEPGRDTSARLRAAPYAPAIHDADQGEVPPFESGATPTVSILHPVAILVRSDGAVLARDADGSWQSRILVSFLRPSGLQTSIVGAEARFRLAEADGDEAWTVTPAADVQDGELSLRPVEDGVEYLYQLRWVLRDGARGNWSPVASHLVIGKDGDPSDVTGFAAQQNGNVVTARWDQIPDRDLYGYTLRYGQPAVPWGEGDFPLTATARGTQVATLEMPPGTHDLMIKAIDTSGNESGTEARVRITVVSTFDAIESAAQWPLWPGLHPEAVQVTVTAEDDEDWNAGVLENVTVSGGALEITV